MEINLSDSGEMDEDDKMSDGIGSDDEEAPNLAG